jgi:hypothetical protein
LVDQFDYYILPVFNVDGYAYTWTKGRTSNWNEYLDDIFCFFEIVYGVRLVVKQLFLFVLVLIQIVIGIINGVKVKIHLCSYRENCLYFIVRWCFAWSLFGYILRW